MAHIKRVHIKEFRGLRDCMLNLDGGNQVPNKMNLIIGANASGKTSLINAIVAGKLDAFDSRCKLEWTGMFYPHGKPHILFSSDRRQQIDSGVTITLIQPPKTNVECERIFSFVTQTLRQQTRRMGRRHSDGTSDREWLARLNAFWTQLRNNGTTVDMDIVDHNDADNTDWNLFLFKGGERICSVDKMSAGEIDAIAFAVPFITMPAPFDGVVLIDDVEAHMTQEWATSLLAALRTMLPEAQFIVTTRLTGWTIPDCAMYDMGAITGKA